MMLRCRFLVQSFLEHAAAEVVSLTLQHLTDGLAEFSIFDMGFLCRPGKRGCLEDSFCFSARLGHGMDVALGAITIKDNMSGRAGSWPFRSHLLRARLPASGASSLPASKIRASSMHAGQSGGRMGPISPGSAAATGRLPNHKKGPEASGPLLCSCRRCGLLRTISSGSAPACTGRPSPRRGRRPAHR